MSDHMTGQLLHHVFETAARGDPGAVIDAIDDFGRTHGGMIHLGAEKGAVFDRIVGQSGARRVLELGTNYGYSALRMARSLDDDARIATVEIDLKLADTAAALIAYAGLDARIEVIRGAAREVIARFETTFDLVFIDHLPQNYLPDLRLIENSGLLHDGSTVITDNVVIFEGQLRPYLDHLRQGGHYESTLHQPSPGADGIEVSTRLEMAASDRRTA